MATDFVSDKNPVPLYKAIEAGLFPEWMGDSPVPNPGAVEGLSKVAFANQGSRLYPLNSPAHTLMSAAYIFGGEGGTPAEDVVANLKSAAEMQGITEDLERIESHFTAMAKEAGESAQAPDLPYALNVNLKEGGAMEGYFPIGNYAQVTDSALALDKAAREGKMPPEWTWMAAQEIVKAANQMGVDPLQMPRDIYELGQERLPNLGYAMTIAEMRKDAGASEEGAQICMDLVKAASEPDADIPEILRLWSDTDRLEGVKYSSAVPDPYRAFYAGDRVSELEKAAAGNVFVAGVMVPKTVVSNMDEESVDIYFNADVASQVKQAAEMAELYPEHASAVFDQMDQPNQKRLLDILTAVNA